MGGILRKPIRRCNPYRGFKSQETRYNGLTTVTGSFLADTGRTAYALPWGSPRPTAGIRASPKQPVEGRLTLD
jgi:hypothetical protein